MAVATRRQNVVETIEFEKLIDQVVQDLHSGEAHQAHFWVKVRDLRYKLREVSLDHRVVLSVLILGFLPVFRTGHDTPMDLPERFLRFYIRRVLFGGSPSTEMSSGNTHVGGGRNSDEDNEIRVEGSGEPGTVPRRPQNARLQHRTTSAPTQSRRTRSAEAQEQFSRFEAAISLLGLETSDALLLQDLVNKAKGQCREIPVDACLVGICEYKCVC